MTVKATHATSGIYLSIFIGVHLVNHLWSIFGIEEHIALMNSLRKLYRNPILETLLLLSIAINLVSGIKLFVANRANSKSRFEKLQLWTGGYLLFFLIIHLTAILGSRLFLHVDTNFYFGVAGINTFPFNLFFIPYYALAVMSFFGHIAAIHAQKIDRLIFRLSPGKQANLIIAIGLVTTVILFYGFTNKFRGVKIPEPYSTLIGNSTRFKK